MVKSQGILLTSEEGNAAPDALDAFFSMFFILQFALSPWIVNHPAEQRNAAQQRVERRGCGEERGLPHDPEKARSQKDLHSSLCLPLRTHEDH